MNARAGVVMEERSEFARQLVDTRAAVADAVIARMDEPARGHASPPIVRSLVSALAQSIGASNPEAVVSWARTAHGANTLPLIHDLVSAGCDIVAVTGQASGAELSSLLAFLEIVKAHVIEAFPLAPGARTGDPHRATSSLIDGVLSMLQARDEALCEHSHATGAWCRRLCEAMGLSSATTDTIVKAAVLHDIGKIATPDAILCKPGPLTDDEWFVAKQHAAFGADILEQLPALAPFAPIVRAHHERWDGRGYPSGLKGEQIPFGARVVAVADAFHAMISARSYRPMIAQRDAMEILREGRGTQWDAGVVDAMLTMLNAPRATVTPSKRDAARG